MKKIIVLAVTTVLIMSSCSTKVSLVKRKYTGGYYVSVTKPNNAEADKQRNVALNNIPEKAPVLKEVRVNPIVAVHENKNLVVPTAISQQHKSNVQKPVTLKNLVASAGNQFVSTGQPVIKHDLNLNKRYAAEQAKASDVNLIIMVILCFFPFINLIPVYLHDGGITLNFWFTLIGDILGGVPGIVIALLVVLDIIDFK